MSVTLITPPVGDPDNGPYQRGLSEREIAFVKFVVTYQLSHLQRWLISGWSVVTTCNDYMTPSVSNKIVYREIFKDSHKYIRFIGQLAIRTE